MNLSEYLRFCYELGRDPHPDVIQRHKDERYKDEDECFDVDEDDTIDDYDSDGNKYISW